MEINREFHHTCGNVDSKWSAFDFCQQENLLTFSLSCVFMKQKEIAEKNDVPAVKISICEDVCN